MFWEIWRNKTTLKGKKKKKTYLGKGREIICHCWRAQKECGRKGIFRIPFWISFSVFFILKLLFQLWLLQPAKTQEKKNKIWRKKQNGFDDDGCTWHWAFSFLLFSPPFFTIIFRPREERNDLRLRLLILDRCFQINTAFFMVWEEFRLFSSIVRSKEGWVRPKKNDIMSALHAA